MSWAGALLIVMASGAVILLFAVYALVATYLHYRHKGATLLGQGHARRTEIEGLERQIQALGEQLAVVGKGVENLRELIADVVIETYASRSTTREDTRPISAPNADPPDTTP